jgi:hypothetical protein
VANELNDDVGRRLAVPFDPAEVKWKTQSVKGNRALAVAYIDARVVMDRLDSVAGPDGWQDEYTVLANDSVMCRLSVRMGDQWVTRMDVGSPSEQPDEGDRTKASVSDALKRAAVKFGIGRYLYKLPIQWCDYDPEKKRLVRTPTLPTWATPAGVKVNRVEPAERKPEPLPAPAAKEREPGDDADDPIGPDEVSAFLDDLHALNLDWAGLSGSKRLAEIIGRNWPGGGVHVTAMTRREFEKLRAVMADKLAENREKAAKAKATRDAKKEASHADATADA